MFLRLVVALQSTCEEWPPLDQLERDDREEGEAGTHQTHGEEELNILPRALPPLEQRAVWLYLLLWIVGPAMSAALKVHNLNQWTGLDDECGWKAFLFLDGVDGICYSRRCLAGFLDNECASRPADQMKGLLC